MDDDLAESEFISLTDLDRYALHQHGVRGEPPLPELADWKTLDDLDVPKANGKFVLSWAYHPRGATAGGSRCHAAYGRHARHGRHRASAGGIRTTQRHHAKSGSGSQRKYPEGSYARNRRSTATRWREPTSSTPSPGRRLGTTAIEIADQEQRRGLEDWCVDDSWFDTADSECRFMHCLPVRRGVVVTDSVLDGPRSVVIHEARNRMYAQMAVLHRMLGAA